MNCSPCEDGFSKGEEGEENRDISLIMGTNHCFDNWGSTYPNQGKEHLHKVNRIETGGNR